MTYLIPLLVTHANLIKHCKESGAYQNKIWYKFQVGWTPRLAYLCVRVLCVRRSLKACVSQINSQALTSTHSCSSRSDDVRSLWMRGRSDICKNGSQVCFRLARKISSWKGITDETSLSTSTLSFVRKSQFVRFWRFPNWHPLQQYSLAFEYDQRDNKVSKTQLNIQFDGFE